MYKKAHAAIRENPEHEPKEKKAAAGKPKRYVVCLICFLRLLSSLWVSSTASASDWCARQEALYKYIDTIQYDTVVKCFVKSPFQVLALWDGFCVNRQGMFSCMADHRYQLWC